jgi:hypothetical protein
MFVLRPSQAQWTATTNIEESLYDETLDWCYNCKEFEGGWFIADRNSLDAYRLALQYALCDAVIIGSNSLSVEGVRTADSPGYIWQSYALCEWEQLKSCDPDLEKKFAAQRVLWQRMGYLSDRRHPAQIVFTWSGDCHKDSHDFLQARIFHEHHPNGERIEVYIATSSRGAARIRSRAALFGLAERIEAMLLVLGPADSEEVDIASLPRELHDRLNMKILNHDGGRLG